MGVNRNAVKSPHSTHALDSAFVPDSEKGFSHRPCPLALVRRAGRGRNRSLAAALVLASASSGSTTARSVEKPVVRASRFHVGNTVFPVQVAVFPDRVARYKPRFLGHTEDSITLRQIASVKVQSGPIFADVVIDTAGGSPPVVIHGLWKKDAEALSGAIAAAQSLSPMPVRPVPGPSAPATAPSG